jgi:hypothetical protein
MVKSNVDHEGLPPDGDTSIKAVGKRLAFIRKKIKGARWYGNPAKLAGCTAVEWRAWESGKALIPKRNAWFIAQRSRNGFSTDIGEYWPSEWIYTGTFTERQVPSPLPRLGNDLSGFASRVRQAIDNHGITLSDIDKADDLFVFVRAKDIRAYAAGFDEPGLNQLESLVDIFEVDGAWLYGQPVASTKPATAEWPRWFKPHLTEGADVYCSRGIKQRIAAACKTTGIEPSLMQRVVGREPASDMGLLTAFAILCGVPLESLIYSADELAILRRRIDRFKRRLGVPGPRRRRASAA